MFVTLVYVKVKPEFVSEFIKASQKNSQQSVRETGNIRFDVLQKSENSSEFVLYEAYDNEASAAAHKETAHYREWRDTVADWMAEPRQGVRYTGL